MRLNTYRCGCGKIETLPNLKAKPGPCTHGARPTGVWRSMPSPLPGHNFQVAETSEGVPWYTARRQRAGGVMIFAPRRDLGQLILACQRNQRERRARAEAFFGALKGLLQQISYRQCIDNAPRYAVGPETRSEPNDLWQEASGEDLLQDLHEGLARLATPRSGTLTDVLNIVLSFFPNWRGMVCEEPKAVVAITDLPIVSNALRCSLLRNELRQCLPAYVQVVFRP